MFFIKFSKFLSIISTDTLSVPFSLSSPLEIPLILRLCYSWWCSTVFETLFKFLHSFFFLIFGFSSVAQSCPTLCDPMNCSMPGLPVHHQLLDFTQTQRPSSWWCHPAISSSVVPSCPQSLPASESFPMSQLFAWGGQSTGVSALASFFSKNTQDWSPLGWTG